MTRSEFNRIIAFIESVAMRKGHQTCAGDLYSFEGYGEFIKEQKEALAKAIRFDDEPIEKHDVYECEACNMYSSKKYTRKLGNIWVNLCKGCDNLRIK